MHCVDLGESFPTSIYLQKSASIQPRTSPSKFGGKLFNIIHSCPYWRADRSTTLPHERWYPFGSISLGLLESRKSLARESFTSRGKKIVAGFVGARNPDFLQESVSVAIQRIVQSPKIEMRPRILRATEACLPRLSCTELIVQNYRTH